MVAGGYAFGEDQGRESERLAAVEQAFDSVSRAALSEAGVQGGWRCWEVGAGRGSMANWLGEAVGPHGRVLATDVDDRWFARPRAANVTFMSHDLAREAIPDEKFDLVHARFVLEHLDEPEAAVSRLAGALRPGGVLVLEDAAGLEFDVDPASELFIRLSPGWERAGLSVGWRATYGRALHDHMGAAGLIDRRGLEYRRTAPGGSAWEHVASGLERLRPELLAAGASDADVAEAIACLRDPGKLITGPSVLIASGRRNPRS